MIDSDDKIPFWRKVGEKVHEYDCKYIMQLSHSGRQRDIAGVENFMNKALSSTSKYDTFHGLLCEAATTEQIRGARRLFRSGRAARAALPDSTALSCTRRTVTSLPSFSARRSTTAMTNTAARSKTARGFSWK